MPSLQKSGGLKFNGTSDYVSVSDSTSLHINSPITLESWFYFNGSSTGNLMWKNNHFGLEVFNSGIAYADSVSWNFATIGAQGSLVLGQVNHAVVTFDGTYVKFYINGIMVANVNRSGSITSNTNTLYFGAENGISNAFKGKVYATRIYNRALSPSEVQMNYQGQVVRDASLVGEWLLNATSGTVATDTSGNGNHGTLNGGQWGTQATKVKPKKNLFDGALELGSIFTANGQNAVSTTQTRSTNYLQVVPNTTYTLSRDGTKITNGYYFFYDNFKNFISYVPNTANPTIPTGCYYVRFLDTNGAYLSSNYQLEQGLTATPFESYQLIPDMVARVNPLQLAPQGKVPPYRGTDFTFARPSVEPYNDTIVPMDTPRVDGNGVMVEEGTVNLLVGKTPSTAGGGAYVFQSDGWTQYIFSAPNYWAGYTGLTYQIGATYTYSVVVKGVAGQQVRLSLYDGLTEFPGSIVTLTGIEQKISFTQTISGSATILYAFIRTASGVQTIYVKSSQVEQKAYPTSFTDNPLGRQAESLTFPTANVLNASAGTIEVWAYEDGINRLALIYDTSTPNRIFLLRDTTIGKYTVTMNGSSISSISQNILSKGWHYFIVKWSGTNVSFSIDGIPSLTGAMGTLPIPTTMYLGSNYVSGGQWNNSIKSLRISNVARSDQEILDNFNQSQAYMHLPFDDSTTKLLNF